MGKYTAFYVAFDKKLNGGLSIMLMLITLIGGTITTFTLGSWNPDTPSVLVFILVMIGVAVGMFLVAITIGLSVLIYTWFVEDFIPSFKETQKEFDYKPSNKAKVEFK